LDVDDLDVLARPHEIGLDRGRVDVDLQPRVGQGLRQEGGARRRRGTGAADEQEQIGGRVLLPGAHRLAGCGHQQVAPGGGRERRLLAGARRRPEQAGAVGGTQIEPAPAQAGEHPPRGLVLVAGQDLADADGLARGRRPERSQRVAAVLRKENELAGLRPLDVDQLDPVARLELDAEHPAAPDGVALDPRLERRQARRQDPGTLRRHDGESPRHTVLPGRPNQSRTNTDQYARVGRSKMAASR
jgi:hypothetical protein